MIFNGLSQTPTETRDYARFICLQGLPILRLAERRNFLNSHHFDVVKVPRLAAHNPTQRVYLALLEDPTLGTIDDPFRGPFRK